VGADASRALAPHGELAVDGAVSTHRQDDPDKLNHSHLRALTDLRNQDHSGALAVPLVHEDPGRIGIFGGSSRTRGQTAAGVRNPRTHPSDGRREDGRCPACEREILCSTTE